VACAVLWSLSGAVAKSIPLDGVTIAIYRSLFAGLVLLPLVPRSRWVFRAEMVPLGVVFGAMVGFYLAAVKSTTAANAIYLQYTATFWVVPASALLLHERPDRRTLKAIALAVPGVATILLFGHDGSPIEGRGVLFGLGSGIAYAGVLLGLRRLRELDPVWQAAVTNLGGALALGAWSIGLTGSVARPNSVQTLHLIALGVVQMGIPSVLLARGLREISAPEAGLIALLEPVLNPIWVVLATGERPRVATLIGGCFLLAGVAYRLLPARPATKDDTEPSAVSGTLPPH
jgi:drug/metabolite transporter (DMT)-like permease